jgi:GNAT superfamily N-acetyltransferase
VERSDIIIRCSTLNVRTAELLWIYIDLQYLGAGIGKACIEFIETWLPMNWNTVDRLIVDTVIPKYNSAFYQKMGFVPAGQTFCEFKGVKVPALQLRKTLG